jgi:hypothetical protein
MTETQPKRRGNPNFGKKKPVEDMLIKTSDIITSVEKPAQVYQYVESDDQVWLKLYGSIIGTYSTPGPSSLKAAADNADFALTEYKKRFNK